MNRTGQIVTVSSTDVDYGQLKAAAAVGEVEFLGEHYTPDGTLRAAFRTNALRAPRRNASVRIGPEFFSSALRDYRNWQEKWWREAIQNAVDAGATEVVCSVDEDPSGLFWASVSDNGRGMPPEVILDKFLVLGASGKGAGGTHGGFGKAKELLILPWISWEIYSGHTVVRGVGIEYEVETTRAFQHGVTLRVLMPRDKFTTANHAVSYIKKCYLPATLFSVRQLSAGQVVRADEVRADLHAGEFVKAFTGADLYKHPATDFVAPDRCLVRTRSPSGSLFMFDRWINEAVGAIPIIEITGSSIEMLTANRDGFRNYALGDEVDRFLGKLASDVTSAMRVENGLVKKKYKGTGKYTGANKNELKAHALATISNYGRSDGRSYVLGRAQKQMLAQLMADLSGADAIGSVPQSLDGAPANDVADAKPLNFRLPPEIVDVVTDVEVTGPSRLEDIVKTLVWEPDFYLINEVPGFKVPAKFWPETMSIRVLRLARAWAELCRFVMLQLGSSKDYGVGFIFDANRGAECRHEDGEHWLLLNPYPDRTPGGRIWKLSDRDDVMYLYAFAVHEVTHIVEDLVDSHNEVFASALTRNFAKTAGKIGQVRQILEYIKGRDDE